MQPWQPKLVLSPGLRERIGALVTPYLGKQRATKRLCAKVAAMIAEAYPDHEIEVVDKTVVTRALFGGITLGVVVDGVPDQGIVVMARNTDAA